MLLDPQPKEIKLTLYITKTDLTHGRARDCFTCPVARALLRAGKRAGLKFNHATVSAHLALRTSAMYTIYSAQATIEITEFIHTFDNRERNHLCKPFRTTITLQRKAL